MTTPARTDAPATPAGLENKSLTPGEDKTASPAAVAATASADAAADPDAPVQVKLLHHFEGNLPGQTISVPAAQATQLINGYYATRV